MITTPKSNAEIPPGGRRLKIPSPGILAAGWRGRGGRRAVGCLSTSPSLPLKSNTRSYVSGCLLSQQPGPEVSPALRSRVRESVSPRGSNSPALPRRGLERWGRGDLKVKGWKKAAREGVRINANRKEIHRRMGAIQ